MKDLQLIDTHAHLYFQQFDADLEDVIMRAKDAHITKIINIGINLESSKQSIAMAEHSDIMFAAVGVHPHDVVDAREKELEELKDLLSHPKVVALGEIGLDFYRNFSPQDLQRKTFRMFLDWSLELSKPIIIHTRMAEDAILNILQEKSKTGWQGVFHCFSGNEQMAGKVIEMGFHISFTGNITFKNSASARVLRSIPLEKLLLETDCPFLTPVPYRGKRNEPAYLNIIAKKMAELKEVHIKTLAETTTKNAYKLFKF